MTTTTMTPKMRAELTQLLSYLNGAARTGWVGYQDSGDKKVEAFHYLAVDADPVTNFKPEPLELSIDAYNCLYPLSGEEREDGFFHEAALNLDAAAAHLRELL